MSTITDEMVINYPATSKLSLDEILNGRQRPQWYCQTDWGNGTATFAGFNGDIGWPALGEKLHELSEIGRALAERDPPETLTTVLKSL